MVWYSLIVNLYMHSNWVVVDGVCLQCNMHLIVYTIYHKYYNWYVFTLTQLTWWSLFTDATICYQCSDAKAGGRCKHDVHGMLADRRRLLNMTDVKNTEYNSKFTYLKNCVNAWGEQCLIEDIREAGLLHYWSVMVLEYLDCITKYQIA